MRKSKKRLNINRRNFLTGSVTLAGAAAAATVVPISFAKLIIVIQILRVCQILLNGKIGML